MRRSIGLGTLSLLLIAGVAAAQPAAPGSGELGSYWWMFFVSGENKTPLPKEEAARAQAQHLQNLTRMYGEGKAVMAGPTGDAKSPVRGVVVLTVPSLDALKAEFKDDPFVKGGYLKIQAWKWSTWKDAIHRAQEPFELGEYRLVILKKGPNFRDQVDAEYERNQAAHLAYLGQLRKQGDLALAGPLADAGDLRGILIFRATDAKKVEGLLQADPHVRSGRLTAEQLPLHMARGVLDPPAKP